MTHNPASPWEEEKEAERDLLEQEKRRSVQFPEGETLVHIQASPLTSHWQQKRAYEKRRGNLWTGKK